MPLATIYRRFINPKARRTSSTAITHSGGQLTVYGCICGDKHTEATRYRGQSRHYHDWAAAHDGCMLRAIRDRFPTVDSVIAAGLTADLMSLLPEIAAAQAVR